VHRQQAARRPARSRRSRIRANLVCNLITYAVWGTYLAAGVAVAGSHGYLDGLTGPHAAVTAVAAVLLWPLVFLGTHPNV